MLWQKIKDNNFSNKKLSNVVITGGGSQLDNIEKYVETIFASSVRVANPSNDLNLEKDFMKPNYCDIIGTVLYDANLYKINFLENKRNISKNVEFLAFLAG